MPAFYIVPPEEIPGVDAAGLESRALICDLLLPSQQEDGILRRRLLIRLRGSRAERRE
jgi:hypothetical protein